MSKKKKPNVKKKERRGSLEVYFLIATLILLMPFVHSNKALDFNAAPRLLLFGIVVVLFSVWSLMKKKTGLPFLKLAVFPVSALFVIWSVITLLFAVNPGEGSFDIAKIILTLGLLVYATQILINEKKAVAILVKSVSISAVIATAAGVVQYFTKVSASDPDTIYAVKGMMAHKNQFAISLLLMLPFVLYGVFSFNKWWKSIGIYALLMILVNIAIVQTRSVWIATLFFIAGFLVLSALFLLKNNIKGFLVEKRKIVTISLIVLVVGLVAVFYILQVSGTSSIAKNQLSSTFSTKSSNAQWRIKMWNASLQLARDNPLTGVGAGNWKMDIIPYYHLNFGGDYQNWRRPHNDFLWVLTEKGIVGLLLFLVIFGLVFFYGLKILFNDEDKSKLLLTVLMLSGIGAYVVVSLFSFPLERINQQTYLVFMMAVVISLYFKPKTKKPTVKFASGVNLVILVLSLFSTYYAYLFLKEELSIKKIATAMNANHPQRAIKLCDAAFTPFTTIDNNNIPIKMYRGVSNLRLKQYQLAYNDLQEALNSFPNNVAVLNNLAIVSSELGKNKEAIGYLDKALYLFPHYEESLGNKVIVYYRNKKYEKAYEALLSQDTRNPNKQYRNFKSGLEKLLNKQGQH